MNLLQAMRLLIGSLPLSPFLLSSSSMRQNRNQARTGRARIFGPPLRGRGPNLSHRQRNNNSASVRISSNVSDFSIRVQDLQNCINLPLILQDSITNVIESALENHLENVTTNLTHSGRNKRKRRNRRRRNHLNTNIPAQVRINYRLKNNSPKNFASQLLILYAFLLVNFNAARQFKSKHNKINQ